MAVLPGMIEMKAGIIVPALVANPFAVVVYVRGIGMSLTVAKRAVTCFWGACRAPRTFGTVLRNESVADIGVSPAMLAVLCKERYSR
jgi:hypothetical protein